MAADSLMVPAPVLREWLERMLAAAGVPQATACLTADSLVAANLRGVDSHGAQLAVFYIARILSGDMDPRAEGHVVSENGCTLIYDGGKTAWGSGFRRSAAVMPCGSPGSTAWPR